MSVEFSGEDVRDERKGQALALMEMLEMSIGHLGKIVKSERKALVRMSMEVLALKSEHRSVVTKGQEDWVKGRSRAVVEQGVLPVMSGWHSRSCQLAGSERESGREVTYTGSRSGRVQRSAKRRTLPCCLVPRCVDVAIDLLRIGAVNLPFVLEIWGLRYPLRRAPGRSSFRQAEDPSSTR